MQVGLAVVFCLALVLVIAGSARVIYALPLLPALALAATGAQKHVPVRWWNVLGGLGLAIAVLVVPLSWYLWGSLTASGQVPNWQWIARQLPVNFNLPLSPSVVLMAALLSAAWLAMLWYRRRIAQGPLLLWTGSLAVSWALPMLLLMPWIDSAKSYRGVYESMAGSLPSRYTCIQSEALGESERGILEYTQGIITVRKEASPAANCPFLMRQVRNPHDSVAPNADWSLLWTGTRPSCATERFELYASNSLEEGRLHADLMKKSIVASKSRQSYRIRSF
jgi:4-amino-4-deoxy-L-arabinose transferase-like glycosyltransferase